MHASGYCYRSNFTTTSPIRLSSPAIVFSIHECHNARQPSCKSTLHARCNQLNSQSLT